ncbi:hypothetical protein Tsubulata_026699 [Turnera subulata]|uniref:Uncharacterized protein n=1 Tax=Turnera subulata TaxID=218843 RepID=A0A9Q0GG49_9ROSI|nr:hypothetical protein Tsubulata_026699 [Turnera subulata]
MITSEGEDDEDQTKALVDKSLEYWINDLPEGVMASTKQTAYGIIESRGYRKSLSSKILVGGEGGQGFDVYLSLPFYIFLCHSYPFSLLQMRIVIGGEVRKGL